MSRRSEMFPPMHTVVPEDVYQDVKVEHFTVSESASRFTALHGSRDFVEAGRYARLVIGSQTVMSDTRYERSSNMTVCDRAHGRVLVAGYGLGMILTHMLRNRAVSEVVVIENNPRVVKLVDPAIRDYVGEKAARKLRVVVGDAHDPALVDGPFDVLWFDIWGDMSTDCLSDMSALTRKWMRRRRDGKASFMECWDRDWLRWRKRNGY